MLDHRRVPLLSISPLAVLFAASASLGAQSRPSEHALVAQTVNGTTITVEYYRPQARGRDSLFGKVVRMGETWTPGANWATTLDVDRDVTLNGHALAKGKYSVWMIPSPGDWTVMLSKNAHLYHMFPPRPEEAAVRLAVKPVTAPMTEVLTWSFPSVWRDSAQLAMHWGTTLVPLAIGVPPYKAMALGPAQRAIYLGEYDVTWRIPDAPPTPERFSVIDSASGLWIRGPQYDPTIDATQELIPQGSHRFLPGLYARGKPIGAEVDEAVQFEFASGKVVGFTMVSNVNNAVIGRGKLVASGTKP